MTMAIGIDPRIRARRVAVRRAEGRRRLRFLLLVIGLIAAAVAGWAISRSPLLDLDHVRVEGVHAARASAVERTLALEHGIPLIELDLGGLERSLEALPWVETAELSRQWPGTLVVAITEREPVATLSSPDGPVLIDHEGVIIGPAGERRDLLAVDLEVSAAAGATETAALPALALIDAIPPDLRTWIDVVTLAEGAADGDHHLGIELVGDGRAVLGSVEHLDDKLAALRAFLAGADLACVREIDVSVADLPTVRRDPVCDGRTAASASGTADA